ncbi:MULTISPECIES: Rieske (2Fe-2S) protein [Streptomyces]|uniref:Rieske (2Fe-2S) protein n=1 Tax=Streptomyces TaxID=1883 RepID=UPI00131921B2|nr:MULTISPECIES: Rieske (2Fe-2S) protein [Streptomyces]QGZ48231.1 Rieske 2Fe-2S domain-containing protein [Streptomyces sp. QHH-9511]
MTPDAMPRRTVLLAGAGSVAALTTGCGSDGDKDGGTAASPTPTAATPAETSPAASAPVTSAPAGDSLGRTSQIPVGGGTVFKERKVVVTQPTAGEFKAFSAVCTHQGCTVGKVENGTIDCPCHGSRFRIADGSVAAGPASRPLPEERITVSGDAITLA